MRRIFGMKSDEQAEAEELEGVVIARVTVEAVNRYERKVKAYLVERATGKTIYKSEYKTIDPELHAFYVASDELKRYCRNESYVIDGEIMTNVSLPFIENVDGKVSYGR